ncbi:Lysophospholipid acyltransferase LPEAT2 [Camellia lanceoleosa]|uniref:Lysophospholipid acyltransferase LPEAT2 n=1 Tax=Camellia lanceoleosa TaxID=1840588 RepID=A0ACC0IIJ2_9ERIC|nr:Lysophospholipid acyltransferase LPEAT2 [Camellia lanceoleosa]
MKGFFRSISSFAFISKGTTTNGRGLISFQLGVFVLGYPVHPMIVRYPRVHFDQSWGNIALRKLMFRMFIVSQFHGGRVSSYCFIP